MIDFFAVIATIVAAYFIAQGIEMVKPYVADAASVGWYLTKVGVAIGGWVYLISHLC